MRKIKECARLAVAVCALLLAGASHAAGISAVLDEAEQLLRDGHPKQAVALLAPLESSLAGNSRFDYLLGSAELSSGNPDLASLALERAVAIDPLHAGARLDLARAYFLLGDVQRARAELTLAQQLNPPPAAQQIIGDYLAAIAAKESAARIKAAAYVEATIGRDSNINNATNQNQIAIPALRNLVVTLSPSNVAMGDSFRSVAAGGELEMPIGAGFGWMIAANAHRRDNFRRDGFDTAATDLKSGVTFARDNHFAQLSALSGRTYLDNKLNRAIEGGSGEWRELLDANTQLGLTAQYLRYRFPAPELDANNFNQWSASLGGSRVMAGGKAALSTNLLWGHERDTDHRADGPKKIDGLQLAGSWSWDDKTDWRVDLSWIRERYGSINPAFEKLRRDDEFHGIIGMAYKLAPDISLRPELSFSRNRSNLPVFDFRERVFLLKVRYDFHD